MCNYDGCILHLSSSGAAPPSSFYTSSSCPTPSTAAAFNPLTPPVPSSPLPPMPSTHLIYKKRLVNVVYSAAAFPRTRDCAICLDFFQEGDNCSSLPVCKHLFHAKCVDRWVQKRPNCPICRTGVDLDSGLPGSSISSDDTSKRLWPIGFEECNSHN